MVESFLDVTRNWVTHTHCLHGMLCVAKNSKPE